MFFEAADYWPELLPDVTDGLKNLLRDVTGGDPLSETNFYELERYLSSFQDRPRYMQKLLFLFSGPENLSFLDAGVLEYERIQIIPELFHDGSGVFHFYIAEILEEIKKYAQTAKTFGEKYERAKRNNKKNHLPAKRIEAYLNKKYALELIAEYEGFPLSMLDRGLLPFLYWGHESYRAIYDITFGGGEKNHHSLPLWKDGSYAFLPFLGYAALTGDVDVVDGLFKGTPLPEAIGILAEIFFDQRDMYGPVWLDAAIQKDFYKDDKCMYRSYTGMEIMPDEKKKADMFLKFTGKRIKQDDPGGMSGTIRLFFPNLSSTSRNTVISAYLNYISETGKNGGEYRKFIKTIARKAASFSADSLFLPEYFREYSDGRIGGYVIDFLQDYFSFIRPQKEEVILLGHYLYNILENQNGYIQRELDHLLGSGGFGHLCAAYIDDAAFVLHLLAIPAENDGERCPANTWTADKWIDKIFSLWFLNKYGEAENDPLWPHDEDIKVSPEKIVSRLLSAGDIDSTLTDFMWRHIKESASLPDGKIHTGGNFLSAGYFIRTNKEAERDIFLLNAVCDIRARNELDVMRYIKTHGKFNFIDFALHENTLENIAFFPERAFYLYNTNFAGLCLLYMRENGKTFADVQQIHRALITGITPPEHDFSPASDAAPEFWFDFYIDRAVNEKPGEYFHLYTFLAVHDFFRGKMKIRPEKQSPKVSAILDRCRKHLSLFRRMEKRGLSAEDEKFFSMTACWAASIVYETGDCWKGIKPLLLTFRNSRNILLDKKLLPVNTENTAAAIYQLLHRRDNDDRLKKLRRDMADEFCDYLKPLPAKDRGDPLDRLENYTGAERKLEGFDPGFREPNPHWRYAYVRAIADLGVDTDGKGHFFHSVLEKAAENDPSPMVKEAAAKTARRLRKTGDSPEEGSHRRRLIQAFWWLRRAHMLTLDVFFDEKEALTTRNSEFRRNM
ncbi:MAG: hypothetical protein LBI86_02095 [Treponema sp.]|nr:hypothetical protein [Treponema sp.]